MYPLTINPELLSALNTHGRSAGAADLFQFGHLCSTNRAAILAALNNSTALADRIESLTADLSAAQTQIAELRKLVASRDELLLEKLSIIQHEKRMVDDLQARLIIRDGQNIKLTRELDAAKAALANVTSATFPLPESFLL